VIELRFRADLYSGFAIDAAAKVYADFARCELEQTADAWVVRLTGTGAHDEQTVADELANYALGATIEEKKPAV
jgi:hypothetical protein